MYVAVEVVDNDMVVEEEELKRQLCGAFGHPTHLDRLPIRNESRLRRSHPEDS